MTLRALLSALGSRPARSPAQPIPSNGCWLRGTRSIPKRGNGAPVPRRKEGASGSEGTVPEKEKQLARGNSGKEAKSNMM